VTHDQQESFTLADRVAVLRAGRVVQMDTPEAVYAQPVSPFVARFLGLTNLLEATLTREGTVTTACGRFRLPAPPAGSQWPAAGLLLIRPEAARLSGDVNPLRARVMARSFRGAQSRLTLQPEGGPPLIFDFSAAVLPAVGDLADIYLDPEKLTVLPREP
jgi:ABC-type Fe3+/spermidine/putrescine transport system ATPase subunit